MLRISFVDQNNPKDPGVQSDQLTQEIAVGNYNLDIALDAQELDLGPYSKKVLCAFVLPFFCILIRLRVRRETPPTTC